MNLSELFSTYGLCGCSACKGEPQHIQLSGAALEAVHDYQDTVKRLDAERKAANKAMWDAIYAGTGTAHLQDADLTLNTEFLGIGIAILIVPAGLPLEKPAPADVVEPALEQPVAAAA